MDRQDSSGEVGSREPTEALRERLARMRRLASEALPHSPAWEALMSEIDALEQQLDAARAAEDRAERDR
jgi:hypothetical protein